MDERVHEDTIGCGEVLVLAQRSARRREYELRRGQQVLGWLRFPPGRRSTAAAWAGATGSLALRATAGRVEVRGGPDAATIATVERGGAAAVIRTGVDATFVWRRAGRRHRWAIDDANATLLGFTAAHRLLTSSVRITVRQAVAEPTAVPLCLIGGFLAVRDLQSEIDASAAVGGIVAGAG